MFWSSNCFSGAFLAGSGMKKPLDRSCIPTYNAVTVRLRKHREVTIHVSDVGRQLPETNFKRRNMRELMVAEFITLDWRHPGARWRR